MEIEYTPIKVEYISPIDIDSIPEGGIVDGIEYMMEIITPQSSRPGLERAVSQRIILPIHYNEPTYIKLLPSNRYYPLGRYDVKYYKKGKKEVIDHQIWIVPYKPYPKIFTTTIESWLDNIALPLDLYYVVDMNISTPYEVVNNKIIWIWENTTPESKGLRTPQDLIVNYEAYVTLDQVIELENNVNTGSVKYIN